MKRMSILRRLGICLLCAAACGKVDETGDATDGGATTTTAAAAADTGEACTPGYESCECVGGEVCLAGLSCVSKVCVDLGELTTSGGGSAGETTGKDTSEEPPPTGTCSVTAECADTEICVDGFCGDTDLYYFDVRVTRFAPDDCSDGWGAGEVYFAFYSGTESQLQGVSTWSYCPADWSDFEMPLYDSLTPFQLDFWEDDEFEDDYMATLCWDADGNANSTDPCSVVPKHWLREGTVTGYIGSSNQYGITVTFTQRPWEG
ncbi:hypothetical protein OV203_41210 [Nannocystis sp. ILAH1]|uniref:hypothetical protein n=1 Tax=Nannocystis sp. ILAH1 TaxID=2996789 RepID=UPI002270DF1C|nr:hypothetical protein [Nannocystis sp. ILAH1]MCY0989719.1 hypothetical protein [Nannocystis sp. ILAH1]MCY0993630.1 hypothetical protein [Nannocystis sp. ILAH1]